MITGTRLCGAVSLEIDEPLEKAPEACHCSQCRKQTGNFFLGVNVRRSAMRIAGEERISWYQSAIDGYAWTSVALGCLDTETY